MIHYHTLIKAGAHHVELGDTVLATDYQILGHKNNEAITPPEEKWIGQKLTPFPRPTFLRLSATRSRDEQSR
jgi:hypothetical protein